jgi:hypothetical protein
MSYKVADISLAAFGRKGKYKFSKLSSQAKVLIKLIPVFYLVLIRIEHCRARNARSHVLA